MHKHGEKIALVFSVTIVFLIFLHDTPLHAKIATVG